MVEQISKEDIKDAEQKIEKFLSRSFPNVSVTHVPEEEVNARGSAGGDIQKGEFEVYFRVELGRLSSIEVLETRDDITRHLRNQLLEMEGHAPDSTLLFFDNPPKLIDKPLVCYIRSVL